ncbi:jg2490 [Pararge aegeria aegeria]|uniref:Jg2490 protein n=1 Tax=Pararge aegeria aegeria TaxID=348720 RepID=A0A8S4RYY8_9NEOP|nr:jg2490 [Pararge aegeria aegeria]
MISKSNDLCPTEKTPGTRGCGFILLPIKDMPDNDHAGQAGWGAATLGVSLRDKIRNVEIRRSSTSREAEVAMGGAQEGWTLGWSPRCWNGSPALANAALVDPRRGGRTTLGASQVAAGFKRHKTVEFGTPYKRPMSSSGRLSVDMMMMMKI